ncbi:MAG: hypothetical protein ACR2KS_02815 [Candidatus Eremiobacter antarcticus]|nr:hypothetical protein [Candidatus Eremiobacteraeota bacterium]
MDASVSGRENQVSGAPAAAPAAITSYAGVGGLETAGAIVAGIPNGDVIVLSARALLLVNAGRLFKALVIRGLEALHRSIDIGGNRSVCLEHGGYRLN